MLFRSSLADLHVKRAMIKATSKVYLLADSSKIGRTSFSSLGAIDLVHCLVTDDGIRDEDRIEFERLGIQVIVGR